jgi:hypothetical protein
MKRREFITLLGAWRSINQENQTRTNQSRPPTAKLLK